MKFSRINRMRSISFKFDITDTVKFDVSTYSFSYDLSEFDTTSTTQHKIASFLVLSLLSKIHNIRQ